MTGAAPRYPPVLGDAPAALVVDGRHVTGSFDGPVSTVNPLDVGAAGGLRGRLGRRWRDLRMKEWEAFQIGNDEWFVLGAVYDAKVLGLVIVIAVHEPSGRILRWIEKVPSTRVSVARGLGRSTSEGRSRAGRLRITNDVDAGRIGVEGSHAGRGALPAVELTGTGSCGANLAGTIAVCHPFGGDRILYTHKCLMPFEGELRIGTEVIGLEAGSSFMIVDDHHGEYPWPQVYDWVTAARHRHGSLVGFNLTRNQVLDAAVNNENVLWVDGEVHRLPAVRVERPEGVDGPWHVTDDAGAVDVTFTPQVASSLHVGPRRILAEYHAPYGRFTGAIEAGGRRVVVDGMFGMGEKKHVRV